MWEAFPCKKSSHIVNFAQELGQSTMQINQHQKCMESVLRILRDAGIRFACRKNSMETHETDIAFDILPRKGILVVAYYPGLAPRQLQTLLRARPAVTAPNRHFGVCVRQMTWSLLDACKEAGVALFDMSGNAYLRLPGVYIERMRPSREQGPEPASGTVFTAKASRILRAFLYRFPQDWLQADLIPATGLSAGYVSTLLKRLQGQNYITNRRGMLHLEDPDRLLNDWVAHYRFDRHRKMSFAMSAGNYEAGVDKLGKALTASVTRFVWTGWTGAHLRAPYSTPTTYMAYVSETPKVMDGVFPVENGGNVVLCMPHDAGVFQFATHSRAGEIASDAQLYLDLIRMPGRAKEMAEALRYQCLDFSRRAQ
jgi:hypothetical protein